MPTRQPAPALTLQHLKTSKQYNGSQLINRYWFQWQNRTHLSALVVRVDLLDEDGNVLTEASLQVPRTKITGYTHATETEVSRPIYTISVFIQIDDVPRDKPAVTFRYYTVTNLFTKSVQVGASMNGIYEDISMHG